MTRKVDRPPRLAPQEELDRRRRAPLPYWAATAALYALFFLGLYIATGP